MVFLVSVVFVVFIILSFALSYSKGRRFRLLPTYFSFLSIAYPLRETDVAKTAYLDGFLLKMV